MMSVFPLTTLEDAGLTARRTITLDFAPWGDGHTTDIDVTDSYVLTNPTDTDQSVTLVYPFSGSFYALYPPTLTADGAALDAVIRPGVGGSQSLESWEEYAALVEGNDLAAAHAEIPALDTPVTVIIFQRILVISSPSISTSGVVIVILFIASFSFILFHQIFPTDFIHVGYRIADMESGTLLRCPGIPCL